MKNAAAQFVGEPTQTFAAEPVSEAHNCIRAIVGASSGNLVEWYDFYAYAFTSIYFASTFFPSGDATPDTAWVVTARTVNLRGMAVLLLRYRDCPCS